MKNHQLPVLNTGICSFGFDREQTCDTVDPLLELSGIPKLSPCESCNMPESLDILAITDPEAARQALERLGFESAPKSRSTDVLCAQHGNPVVADCGLSDCSLYTTYSGVRNCILVYMQKHNSHSLSNLDLSILLSEPVKAISDQIKSSLSALRKKSIRTSSTYDLDASFLILSDLDVCYCCERVLTPSMGLRAQNFRYCGPECLAVRPPEIVILEHISGLDLDALILWSLGKYSTVDNFVEALGLSRPLLDELVDRYFGSTLESLYRVASAATVDLPYLLKRSGRPPSWLGSLPEATAGVSARMEGKYGPAGADLERLSLVVADLI